MKNLNKLKCCALCDLETKLELSHVVPKMAVRNLKKTSVGNIRNSVNPNMVVQDSEKHYMLCEKCEVFLANVKHILLIQCFILT